MVVDPCGRLVDDPIPGGQDLFSPRPVPRGLSVLVREATYPELGADYFDPRHRERAKCLAIQPLERQWYRVILELVA